MLHIIVNLCPFGDQYASRKISEVFITNDLTGNEKIGNYDVVIKKEDGELVDGHVSNHSREEDALILVFKSILNTLKTKDGTPLNSIWDIVRTDHT